MLTFPFPALPALLAAWLAQTHAVMAQSPSIAEGGVPAWALVPSDMLPGDTTPSAR